MATCEHTMTDKYQAVLRCVSKNTEPLSIKGKTSTTTYYYCVRHYFVHSAEAKSEKMCHVKDILPGDVLTTPNGSRMVLDLQITAREIKLLLAEGRTDPGEWESFYNPYETVTIYRPQRP